MLARAVVVLLLILNLGVAAWWALRAPPSPPPQPALPDGAVRLQLLQEAPASARARAATAAAPTASAPEAATTPAAAQATPTTAPAAEASSQDLRCYRFGPFDDAQRLAAARTLLQPQSRRLQVRETVTGARGWRVILPPLPDRAAADAVAARIVAAGFSDYFVVREGAEANAIALGRYGSETSARQREAALRAAGFAAQAQPLGDVRRRQWLDVAVAPAFDPAVMQRASDAAQAEPVDCAEVA